MTQASDYGKRLTILRLAGSLAFIALIGIGIALFAVTRDPAFTPPLFVAAISLRVGVAVAVVVMSRRYRALIAAERGPYWWYHDGVVEQSPRPPGPNWDGPYMSREDAERAPEIARERGAAWNAED